MAAKQIAKDTNDQLINIVDCINNEKYDFTTKKDERVGFIFPVYFYTIPHIVKNFIEKLNLNHSGYTYAMITCGGSISGAGHMLKKELSAKNIDLHQVYSVVMPDNAVLYYDVDSKEKTDEILTSAYYKIDEISELILKEEKSYIRYHLFSNITQIAYNHMDKTKKFYTDDKCILCGKCVKICPEKVIEIKDKKVQWTKKRCSKCLACINRCPKKAIQYGSKTSKRNRYVNPIFK